MLDKILHALKSNEGYISGEEISHTLDISRSGIWKYIQELRNHGYDIIAVPHLGYKLVSSPDKLFPEEIKFRLGTKILAKRIEYFDVINSTMDEAFRLGMAGAEEGTLICAEGQTKGRGRLGRGWTSPKGKGIYISILLRPKLQPLMVSQLTLLCAVAVAEAIERAAGINMAIKWPNDVLINNKKVVGILTEMNAETDRIKFVIVGIGVNVNATNAQLPAHATSLRQEMQKNFSRIEILQEILRRFEYWYLRFQKEGFAPILEQWKDLSVTLGRNVRIADTKQVIDGKAIGIDEDGGLLIKSHSGAIVKKMSGDVIQIS